MPRLLAVASLVALLQHSVQPVAAAQAVHNQITVDGA